MRIFRYIWNALFGESKEQQKYKKGGLVGEAKMDIVHNKNAKKTIGAYNTKDNVFTDNKICQFKEPVKDCCVGSFVPNNSYGCKPLINIPNGDDFFASNEIIEKEKKMDSEFANLPKKKSKKMNIGKKTLFEIKVHILEYGSLNTYDCKQIFKVKSLNNFISALRSQGFVFTTEKMIIKDVSGQVIEKAVNYTLIDKK